MDDLKKSLCLYVAYLRSLYLVNQNFHWISSGPNFYALHLMFERIYELSQKHADEAAEKFVGLFGKETISVAEQSKCIAMIMARVKSDDPVEASLELEKEFLEFSNKIILIMKSEEKENMTPGLEDMLMSIHNERETALYLLKQTLGG